VFEPFAAPKTLDPNRFVDITAISVMANTDCDDDNSCPDIRGESVMQQYPLLESAMIQVQHDASMTSRYSANTTEAFAMSDDLVKAGASVNDAVCFEDGCHELWFRYNGTSYKVYFEHPVTFPRG
jgi:hypothetical protein